MTNDDILGGLDDLLAIMRDPGIIERRQKVWAIKFSANIMESVFNMLRTGAAEGHSLEEICTRCLEATKRVYGEMVRDIEAIDKPPQGAV